MFGKIGLTELVVIFAVVLLVFGPSKLPQIGSAIGKGIREFKSASRGLKEELEVEADAGEDVKN